MKILKNKVGLYLYLLLPIRFSWFLINEYEKKRILENDYRYNNSRDDYRPQDYQEGMSWDKFSIKNDYRGWMSSIDTFLGPNKSLSVLEIGPGSGFYSRYICEHNSVGHYSFYEINEGFSIYLKKKLKFVNKKFFTYSEIDIKKPTVSQNTKFKYDRIIFLSSFHHMPNRKFVFDKIDCLLKKNKKSKILFIEPTHYFFRIVQLCKKFIWTYRNAKYQFLYDNLSTHHFCTLKEFQLFSMKNKTVNCKFLVQSKKIRAFLSFGNKFLPTPIANFIKLFFSNVMVVTMINKN